MSDTKRYVANVPMNDDRLGPIAVGQEIELSPSEAAPLLAVNWISEKAAQRPAGKPARASSEDSD